MKKNKIILAVFFICIPIFSLGKIVFDPRQHYFERYYTEETYKQLEKLYNGSQYRLKNPTSIIADEIVFRYASGAYIRGVDPILVNSEITPLGKYIVGLSYLWFQTESVVMLISTFLSLFALWLLGRQILGNVFALLPVALFSLEPLFRNQLFITPLMDIIQLPFILLSLYAFIRKKFFWSAVFLGFTAATKSVVPAILLIFTFVIFSLRSTKSIRFVFWLPVSFFILLLSYLRTFLNGYNFWDFLGFQKWILFYQQSKLIFPLSFWKLMFFNQWQTWWGDMAILKAEDWRLTWPVLVTVPFILILRKKMPDPLFLLVGWVLVYEIFLSFGVIVTRFLLPLLPILYILSVQTVRELVRKT